jgi:hypothetical protein
MHPVLSNTQIAKKVARESNLRDAIDVNESPNIKDCPF